MTTNLEPGAPRADDRAPPGLGRRLYQALVSPKLAIGLLLVVLGCCLVGVTIYRGEEAGRVIFATLWFNGLLVLLAISSASAFFSRFWKRKRTLVSVGMITFHVSFLGVLGGVVLNGLFSFQGTIRLTEGETLPLGQPTSYDRYQQGRLFDPAWLRGELTLVKMHTDYQVDGQNKRAAYELDYAHGPIRQRGFIYITEYMSVDGIRLFSQSEGYAILTILEDRAGKEVFGAYVPLQSIRQGDGSYLYATGTPKEAGFFLFPPPPEPARMQVELDYFPGLVARTGQVRIQARALSAEGQPGAEQVAMVPVGGRAPVGDAWLSPRGIHYWVAVSVRYDPGLNIILTSLTFGLVGMALTFVGRVRKGGPARKTADGNEAREASAPRQEDL